MARDARRAWAQTLVGRTLAARYRIDRLIDVGGMGAVFEGLHLEVGRPVAIKTVVPGALDDTQTERLRREARQAAAVGGPGVVYVTDFGVDPDCGPFLVMELLEGETLAARLARGRLEVAEALAIAAAVLETLAAVHARGIVHRDLKPENLFLARQHGEERVKILDFGIARGLRASGDTVTGAGAIVGTPRFMAPEQARGDSLDPRVDVYAVGAILYAMLSGRRPYDDLDHGEVVVAAQAGPPAPLAELAPWLAPEVIALVERAMAREPSERFAGANAMAAVLRAASGDAPPLVVEGTLTAASAVLPRRAPPRRAAWVAPLLVVCGLAALALAWSSTPPEAAPPAAPRASGAIAPASSATGDTALAETSGALAEPSVPGAPALVAVTPSEPAAASPPPSAEPSALVRRARPSKAPSAPEDATPESPAGPRPRSGSLRMEDF